MGNDNDGFNHNLFPISFYGFPFMNPCKCLQMFPETPSEVWFNISDRYKKALQNMPSKCWHHSLKGSYQLPRLLSFPSVCDRCICIIPLPSNLQCLSSTYPPWVECTVVNCLRLPFKRGVRILCKMAAEGSTWLMTSLSGWDLQGDGCSLSLTPSDNQSFLWHHLPSNGPLIYF